MAVCKVSIHAAGSEKTVDIQLGTRLSEVLRDGAESAASGPKESFPLMTRRS